jgi:L-threonylcarbamoyladenylate synthase
MSIISNCTVTAIKDVATALIKGDLVAFPTETVYGLGADATNEAAIERIYVVKGRPKGHPLIVHISSMEHLNKWAREIPEYAVKLAQTFWPGPMTLILLRTDLAKDFITGGQDNVGIRVPSHTIALALLNEFEAQGGEGIAAPSANRFGAVSPTTASAVDDELGAFFEPTDQILNGGNCKVGIESTIIDCRFKNPVIVRPGAVTLEMIKEFCKPIMATSAQKIFDKQLKVSGLLESHYAPKARVILNGSPKVGDGFIGVSSIKTRRGIVRLASPQNNLEFAQILYKALRTADQKGIERVIIATPSNDGIGFAINERLSKASFRK